MLIMIAQSSDWMDIRILLEIFLGFQIQKLIGIIKHKFMIFILNIGYTIELILIYRTFSKIPLCIANGMIMRFWTTLEQIGPIGIVKTKIEQDIRILFMKAEIHSLTFLQ